MAKTVADAWADRMFDAARGMDEQTILIANWHPTGVMRHVPTFGGPEVTPRVQQLWIRVHTRERHGASAPIVDGEWRELYHVEY